MKRVLTFGTLTINMPFKFDFESNVPSHALSFQIRSKHLQFSNIKVLCKCKIQHCKHPFNAVSRINTVLSLTTKRTYPVDCLPCKINSFADRRGRNSSHVPIFISPPSLITVEKSHRAVKNVHNVSKCILTFARTHTHARHHLCNAIFQTDQCEQLSTFAEIPVGLSA